jgi:hypothetical protein
MLGFSKQNFNQKNSLPSFAYLLAHMIVLYDRTGIQEIGRAMTKPQRNRCAPTTSAPQSCATFVPFLLRWPRSVPGYYFQPLRLWPCSRQRIYPPLRYKSATRARGYVANYISFQLAVPLTRHLGTATCTPVGARYRALAHTVLTCGVASGRPA